jgi:hypothetical protein
LLERRRAAMTASGRGRRGGVTRKDGPGPSGTKRQVASFAGLPEAAIGRAGLEDGLRAAARFWSWMTAPKRCPAGHGGGGELAVD